MKRLFLQLFFLLFIVLASILIFARFCQRELDPQNYLSVIVNKHKMLEAVTSPRLILIGDSLLVFGVDGEEMEKELGVPTVNMGLHAAFGLPFIFKEILPDIKKGDTVVAIFHYYPSDKDINNGVVCHALDFYPEMYKRLELNYFLESKLKITCDIKKIRRFILNKIYRSDMKIQTKQDNKNFDYKSWAFNDYGDIYSDLYMTSSIKFSSNNVTKFDLDQAKTFNLINYYQKIFEKRGVNFFIIFPPYSKTSFERDSQVIDGFSRLLHENTDVEILSTPENSVLDGGYFFNSDYHLTSQGKEIYTKFIIDLLRSELK